MKQHPTLEGIFVTESGEVYTTRKNSGGTPENPRLLSGTIDKQGYIIYSLSEGKRKGHRLVAQTFIPNPNDLPKVNHLDENKQNNHINNLEWSTTKHNAQWSICQHKYTILHIPTGDVYETHSLNEFIEEHNLTTNLYQTYGKFRKTNGHRGYRVISITDESYKEQ
jgi:hypothetical protein